MQNQVHFNHLTVSVQSDDLEYSSDGILISGYEIQILHPFGETKFFRNGFHSWSLCSWIPLNKSFPKPGIGRLWPQVDHPDLFEKYPFSSSGFCALEGENSNILFLGALDLDALMCADKWMISGRYRIPECESDQTPPNKAYPEWFLTYGTEAEVFDRYANRLLERFGRRRQASSPNVWCSWYSYFTQIDQEKLIETLSSLKDLPFDVFQIDDGWQLCMGDWEPNQKFHSGMKSLADTIRGNGLIPGIWLAPFIVQPQSSLVKVHPQWLLKDQNGDFVTAGYNWGDVFYALDTTNPEVLDWSADLIETVCKWGYRYLKLDFLYAGALPGNRWINMPDEQAYRMGLLKLREAAGDAYILACGAPILASLGIADALRIGPDVAPIWDNIDRSRYLHDLSGPSTLNAIRTSIHRHWLNALIQVDPDVVFFRTKMNLLNSNQRQYLKDLATIYGFIATSDPPTWLNSGELTELRDFLKD